jgi:hypothetical protein
MKITMAHALRRSSVVAALVAGLAAPSVTAMAAAQVSGSPQNVSVDAQNSSLKDILSALGKQFNVHYQSTANLDKQLSGTYEGSLRRVVARLLEGYNFIITTNQDMIEVTVLGTQSLQTGGAPSPITGSNAAAQAAQPQETPTSHPANPATGVAPSPFARVAEQHPVSTDKASSSPAPLPPFHVAEGPSLTPTPSDSPTAGPVLAPATASAPEPKPSTAAPFAPPMPAPSTAQMPMPTGTTAFPMSGETANPTPPAASTAPPTPDAPPSPKQPGGAPAAKQQ